MTPHLRAVLSLAVFLAFAAPGLAEDAPRDHPAVFADRAAFASDFNALYAEMQAKHPDLYRHHAKSEWDARYAALRAEIPHLDWPHFVIALHRFVAMAGDGHTNLLSTDLVGPGFDTRYTIRFGLFSDGLYVIGGSEEIKQAIGRRVTAVNGHPIGEVERELTKLTGHDSPMWAVNWVPLLLTYPGNVSGLDLGLLDMPMKLTLEVADHRTIDVPVPSAPTGTQPKRLTVFDVLNNGHALPPWWSQDEPLTFQYWRDTGTVYAIFAEVEDGKTETLKQLASKLFIFVATNGAKRLIIDVRNNGGGDNTLLAPLIEGARTSAVNHPGGLYVIIGRQTFSAAQNFVNRMESSTQALFAGEPTGESPNQSGDPEVYHLPRTATPVLISTKRWQDSAAADNRVWTLPDIPASLSFADFINGRDPIVAAILAFDASKIDTTKDLTLRWMRPSQQMKWSPPIPVE